MRHIKTKRMMDYWLNLLATANDGNISNPQPIWPDRSDIQPASCSDILGDMFILDLKGAYSQYRLAGTRLCAMHGRELKNERFANSFVHQDQLTAENWAHGVGHEDYSVLICSDAASANGKILPLETLLLPLNHHGLRGHRSLGITVPLEDAFWVGSVDLKQQSIRSVRILRPWEQDVWGNTNLRNDYSTMATERRHGVATPAIISSETRAFNTNNQFDPALEPTSVPYLRVIDGGKQN